MSYLCVDHSNKVKWFFVFTDPLDFKSRIKRSSVPVPGAHIALIVIGVEVPSAKDHRPMLKIANANTVENRGTDFHVTARHQMQQGDGHQPQILHAALQHDEQFS